MEINIIVRDKIASGDGTWIVCGNSDYIVRFTLDSEWDQFITRTMIVVNADKTYQEVVFTGDTAALPVINNQKSVSIGLYAGDLHTTTSAYFNCKKSARDGLGEHEEPSKDVYNQLVQLVENGAVKGDKGDKTYLHIAYANSEDGETDFTTSPVSDKVYTYLGQYSDYTPEDSTVPSTYVWSKLTEEAERAAAELIRVAAEEERVAAETARVSAESQRDSAESNRNIAEETRVSNESARKTAEISRVSAENTRYTSETSRVNAETSRVNAETIRVSAENERVAEWAEIKSDVESSVGSAVASASDAAQSANAAAEIANAAAEKSVRYDVAQTLSDAQKAQARGNIDAAGANEVAEMRGDLSVLKEFTYGKHAYGENIVRKSKTYPAGTVLNQTSFSVTFNRDDIGASDSMIVLDCLGYISAEVEANEIDLGNLSHTFRFQCAGIPWGVGMNITTDWGSKAWFYDSRRETIKGYTNENPPGTDTHLIQIRTIQSDYTTTGPVTITYTAHRLYANGI